MRTAIPALLVLALAACATTGGGDPTANLENAEVTTRVVDGDRIEEYRVAGKLHVVKVTPQRGAPYFLQDRNHDGRIDRDETDGPVSPVLWKLLEWN